MIDPTSTSTFVANYVDALVNVLPALDRANLAKAVQALRDARDASQTVFACGNGGSASIASQMVVDLVKGASYGRDKRFKMMALTDSISTMTAYANDTAYTDVFVEPLRNFAEAGDVIIAISGSGNSTNVLNAVDYANAVGCISIGLTSAEQGRLRESVTIPLLVPCTHMGRLEDCFFIMTHILAYALMEPDDALGG